MGISISALGAGATNVVLNHVDMENNLRAGLNNTTSTQTINVTVSDSVSANNTNWHHLELGGGNAECKTLSRW